MKTLRLLLVLAMAGMIYGQEPQFGGGQFGAVTVSDFASLTDGDTTGIVNESIWKYNSTSAKWEISTDSEGAGAAQWNDFGSFLKPIDAGDVAIHLTDAIENDSLIIIIDASGNVTFTTTTGNIIWATGNTGDAAFQIPTGSISTAEILNATILTEDIDANAAIAQTQMANMTNARMLGNNSGGATTPQEMTAANVLTFLGVTSLTAGSVIFADGSVFAEDNANFFWDDANNRLGIGTNTPVSPLEIQSLIASMRQTRYSNTGVQSAGITVQRSGGVTVGTDVVVQDGWRIANFNLRGFDGSSYISAATIEAFIDGTPGVGDMPGRLVFSTTADGASSVTERMRIVSNGNVGIGTTNPLEELHVVGEIFLDHTATAADEHAIEIDVDAAGFGDVKGLEIEYDTGAIATGSIAAVILVDINQIDATGGDVIGLEILSTDGGADNVAGIKIGAELAPLVQNSGSFANPALATNNTTTTNVPDMVDGSTGTNTTIFAADNDFIIIGANAAFTEIEFVIETGFGNPGIQPVFAFSTSGTNQFTNFDPTDGTDGLKNAGAFVVAWDADEVPGHVADDVTGEFDIRITRTANPAGSVSLFYAKTAATRTFGIDKDGNVRFLTYIFEGATDNAFEHTLNVIDPTADRLFNFPDDQLIAGDVLVASDASDLEYLNLGNTQILIGDGSGIPTAAALSGGATMDNAGVVAIVTNANLTGHITSTGNAAILGSFTVGQLSTALSDATISGNNSGDEPAADLTTPGIIEIATGAETNTGTDATRAVSPDGLDDWTGSAQFTTTGVLGSGSIASGFGAIDNGSSNITSTGTVNFGGASLEITNSDDPTTSATVPVAYDNNNDAVEVFDAGRSDSYLIGHIQQSKGTIIFPDTVQSLAATHIEVFRADVIQCPFGATIHQVSIQLESDAAWQGIFEEWTGDPIAVTSQIDTVATGASDTYAESVPLTDTQIAADNTLMLELPTTNVDKVTFFVYWSINDGN